MFVADPTLVFIGIGSLMVWIVCVNCGNQYDDDDISIRSFDEGIYTETCKEV